MFPHFVAINMDDFTHDIYDPVLQPHSIFTTQLVARFTSGLRRHAPWMSFVPTMYYSEHGFIGDEYADLFWAVDFPLFYFRNQKQGAGPCAPAVCPWGYRKPSEHTGGCLAGACAEPTVMNAPDEIMDMAAAMPPARGANLLVGFYATAHSHLGNPTARYVYDLMPIILDQPSVIGIVVFRFLAPKENADCNDLLSDKGCVVQKIFREVSGYSG